MYTRVHKERIGSISILYGCACSVKVLQVPFTRGASLLKGFFLTGLAVRGGRLNSRELPYTVVLRGVKNAALPARRDCFLVDTASAVHLPEYL